MDDGVAAPRPRGRSRARRFGAHPAPASVHPGPWAFTFKGWLVRAAVTAALLHVAGLATRMDPWMIGASYALFPAAAGLLAQQFTGASTITSLSGVRKEIRISVWFLLAAGVLADRGPRRLENPFLERHMRYLANVVTLRFDPGKCTGCGRAGRSVPMACSCPRRSARASPTGTSASSAGRARATAGTARSACESGVGCASAIIAGALRGHEPTCGCGSGGSTSCCG